MEAKIKLLIPIAGCSGEKTNYGGKYENFQNVEGGGIVIALAAALVFSACSNSSSDGGKGPTGEKTPIDMSAFGWWSSPDDEPKNYTITKDETAKTVTIAHSKDLSNGYGCAGADIDTDTATKIGMTIKNNTSSVATVRIDLKDDSDKSVESSATLDGSPLTLVAKNWPADEEMTSKFTIPADGNSTIEITISKKATKVAVFLDSLDNEALTNGSITIGSGYAK